MFIRSISRATLPLLCLAGAAAAQDSVSKVNLPLPGDAVEPWDASEQRNDYVVDLTPFRTSWGVPWGIAPIVKAGKGSSSFANSLGNAQAISSTLLQNQPFAASSYAYWNRKGFGVNGNSLVQDAPGSVSPGGLANQFAIAYHESGGTDVVGPFYDSIVGAIVNYRPNNPSRLFVSRINAAVDGTSNAEDNASFGMGSVDAHGNVHFRADGFGAFGPDPFTGNNIFRVNLLSRTTSAVNSFSNTGGPSDGGASTTLVNNSGSTHAVPGMIPTDVNGTRPVYIGGDFNDQLVFEGTAGVTSTTTAHLGTALEQRGTVHFTQTDVFGGSTVGTGLLYTKDGIGDTRQIRMFGLNADGSVSGSAQITPPATITDTDDGHTWPSFTTINEFIHHTSQVPFRGGNGQVAMTTDANGDVLVATPISSSNLGNERFNAIAVARFDPSNIGGTLQWTLASWADLLGGKQIKDGSGGASIGEITTLDAVTGGTALGPSVSSPMMDSMGNIYFYAAVDLDRPFGSDFDVALVRAVYDATSFSYELDLVLEPGNEFYGRNSDTWWQVRFMRVSDGNSVASDAPHPGNMIQSAFNNTSTVGLNTRHPNAMGGMILNASIVYDSDRNGDFDTFTGNDQRYNSYIYIGRTNFRRQRTGALGR